MPICHCQRPSKAYWLQIEYLEVLLIVFIYFQFTLSQYSCSGHCGKLTRGPWAPGVHCPLLGCKQDPKGCPRASSDPLWATSLQPPPGCLSCAGSGSPGPGTSSFKDQSTGWGPRFWQKPLPFPASLGSHTQGANIHLLEETQVLWPGSLTDSSSYSGS